MDTAHKNARKRASLYASVVQFEDERLNSLALELERPNASVGKQTSRSLRSLIDSAWRARRSELFAYKRCITVSWCSVCPALQEQPTDMTLTLYKALRTPGGTEDLKMKDPDALIQHLQSVTLTR